MSAITADISSNGVLHSQKPLNVSVATPKGHLAMLDGLRGLAALSVLLVHVFGELHLQSSSGAALEHFVPHVHLAVDFFFMLSGFVVAKAYEAKLLRTMSFSRFMRVRLMRLYPLIFMGVALGTLSLALRVVMTHTPTPAQLLSAALSSLLILPTTALLSVYPGELFPIDFPQWSLLFEIVINIVYAAIVRWLSVSRVIMICGASFIALCCIAASSDRLLDIGMGVEPVGIIPANIWCGLIRVTFPFFLGVLLFRRRISWRRGNPTSVLLCLVFLATLFMPVFRNSWTYEVAAVALIFPLVLSVGATCQPTPKVNTLFIALGELSYPLYITHNPVTRIFINAVKVSHLKLGNITATVLCCATAILAAIVLLYCWDRPIRSWLSRRARRAGPEQLAPLNAQFAETQATHPG